MDLELWLLLNQEPGESRSDAISRYADSQGYEDPAEKQKFVDDNAAGDDYRSWGVREPEPVKLLAEPDLRPTEQVQDPDWTDQLGAGFDELHAGAYSSVGALGGGFLEDIGQPEMGRDLKDWAEEGREEQLAEAALVPQPKTREQILEEDPDSLYGVLPEFTPTGHEMVRGAPTSLGAAAVAAPLAIGAGALAPAGLATLLVGGGVGMVAGNVAGSAQVAGESYERAKEDKVIREQLGIDPDTPFKDLSPEDKQKIDRIATDISQTSFGHRLYTSGLVEMASYIPYGGALVRWAADTGLGTASEMWDRELYAEDAVDNLVDYGLPRHKAEEFRERILSMGPGAKETFIKSLVQEGVFGGGFTAVESIVGKVDGRVNSSATASKKQIEEQEKMKADLSDVDRQIQLENEKKRLKTDPVAAARQQAKEDAQEARKEQDAAYKNYQNEKLYEYDIRKKDIDELEKLKNAASKKTKEERDRLEKIKQDFDKLQTIKYNKTREAEHIAKLFNEIEKSKAAANTKEKIEAARQFEQDVLDEIKEVKRDRGAKYKILSEKEINQRKLDKEIERGTARSDIQKQIDAIKNKGIKSTQDIANQRILERKLQETIKSQEKAKQETEQAIPDKPIIDVEQAQEKRKQKLREEAKNKLNKEVENGGSKDGILNFRKSATVKDDKKNVTLGKRTLQLLFKKFEKRNKNLAGKYTVLENNDEGVAELTNVLKKARLSEFKDKDGNFTQDHNLYEAKAKEILAQTNGFVIGEQIYLNASNLKGETRQEAIDFAVEIGVFHEPITHIGLKKFVNADGKDNFGSFLDGFYKTHKEAVNTWATQEAKDEDGNFAYLDKDADINKLSKSKQRELAEEYIAHKWVEHGVRDPDIISKVGDSLKTSLLKTFGRERITEVKVRSILADVQRHYIGGKKNFITGDAFDPTTFTKFKPDTVVDEEKKGEPKVDTDVEAKEEFRERILSEETTEGGPSIRKSAVVTVTNKHFVVTHPDTGKKPEYFDRVPGKQKAWKIMVQETDGRIHSVYSGAQIGYNEGKWYRAQDFPDVKKDGSVKKGGRKDRPLFHAGVKDRLPHLERNKGQPVVNYGEKTADGKFKYGRTYVQVEMDEVAVRKTDESHGGDWYVSFGMRVLPKAEWDYNPFDKYFTGDVRFSKAARVGTPEFKKWFGKSKVVDGKGKPLVVYHGSPDFKGGSFKGSLTQKRDPGDFGEGFYFSKSPKDASIYASSSGSLLGAGGKPKSSEVIPSFLSIENPFNVKNISNTDWDRIESAIGSPISKGFRNDVKGKNVVEYVIPQMKGWAKNIGGFKTMLEKAGYDGVFAGSEIIAYKPNQIKSQFNVGTYDKSNPDIRLSKAIDSQWVKGMKYGDKTIAATPFDYKTEQFEELSTEDRRRVIRNLRENLEQENWNKDDIKEFRLNKKYGKGHNLDPMIGKPILPSEQEIEDFFEGGLSEKLDDAYEPKDWVEEQLSSPTTRLYMAATDYRSDLNKAEKTGKVEKRYIGGQPGDTVTVLTKTPGKWPYLGDAGLLIPRRVLKNFKSDISSRSLIAGAEEAQTAQKEGRDMQVTDIRFSQILRSGKIKHGEIIVDPLILDLTKIRGISSKDIDKIVAGNGPFVFAWDRMRGDGFFVTPSGIRIPLQGGPANSYITYNMAAGIIGSSKSDLKGHIINRVNQSNGIGLVALLGPESHKTNPTFFRIYTQVLKDLGNAKQFNPKDLHELFYELIHADPKKAPNKALANLASYWGNTRGGREGQVIKTIFDAKTPKQAYGLFEKLGMHQLKFDTRGKILSQLGSQKNAKEIGFPHLLQLVRDTIDPNLENLATGSIIQAMQFDKNNPVSTAQARGLPSSQAHWSFDMAFIGKNIARFREPVPVEVVVGKFMEKAGEAEGRVIAKGSYTASLTKRIPVGLDVVKEDFLPYKGQPKLTQPQSKEVRFSKVPRAKASDMSPESLFSPEGNIRASKVLLSRAARFAMATGGSQQKTGWRYRLAKKLTKRLVAQGSLNDAEFYKALRRRAKGTIYNAEKEGRILYDILRKAKHPDKIYDYMTTLGANPNMISDPKERQAAKEAKQKIQDIGNELVKRGLMAQGQLNKYQGQYLPRMYFKHLLDKDDYNAVISGGKLSNLNYLKKRKDIPKGIRELILGEVKDPAFLAAKATVTPTADIAMVNFLEQIAIEGAKGDRAWVVPDSFIDYDMLGRMKHFAKGISPKLIKDLELRDTTGAQFTAYWLRNEADRIDHVARTYLHDNVITDTEMLLVTKLVTDMKNVSEKGIPKNFDGSKYRQVPESQRFGMLAGIPIRKEIYDDILGGVISKDGEVSTAERILGDGGLMGDFSRFWKWAKVSANPPSWVRNFTSNLILMNLGGVPFYKMPMLLARSAKELKNNGMYAQLANDLGLTAGTFANVEMGRIEKEFNDMARRMERGKGHPMEVLGYGKGAFDKLRDWSSDKYGSIDALGKTMMLMHEMQKAKLKPKDLASYSATEMDALDNAALNAEKYLFDYSNVVPSVRYLRQAVVGAPFASFYSFVAPLMIETIITKPWKFVPYYALGFAMKEWFKNNNDLDEEQYEGLKVGLAEYYRNKAKNSIFPAGIIPLPYIDENGRVQFLDVSYLFPWGTFSEMAGEIQSGEPVDAIKTAGLMGGPLLNLASASLTGIDPFSQRQIVDEYSLTWTEKGGDVFHYLFNMSMPPMLHGMTQPNEPNGGFGAFKRIWESMTGVLTKEGEAKYTSKQAVAKLAGINISPLAVPEGRNKMLRYEYSRIQKLQREMKRRVRDMMIMQRPQTEIKEEMKEYGEKLQTMTKEFIKKAKKSTPPKQLLKEREAALKKIKARQAA